jgi:hypothetical protein
VQCPAKRIALCRRSSGHTLCHHIWGGSLLPEGITFILLVAGNWSLDSILISERAVLPFQECYSRSIWCKFYRD